MIVSFEYGMHADDSESLSEALTEALSGTGLELTDELMDKIGQPFYEVVLECTLDTGTGSVAIHSVQGWTVG